MNLTLTRKPSDGMSVRGTLSPLGMSTLENRQYLIPCGTYPLEVTYSPRFKRLMPLVSAVPVRGSGPATLKEYGVPDATAGSCGGERRNNEASDEPSESRERSLFRRGIRFHPGTKPEHSRGCILISRSDEDRLCDFITSHAPVTLKIING